MTVSKIIFVLGIAVRVLIIVENIRRMRSINHGK